VPRGEYAAAKAENDDDEKEEEDEDETAPDVDEELEAVCGSGDSLMGRERAVAVNSTASSANEGALTRRCGRAADPDPSWSSAVDRASEEVSSAGLTPKLPERAPAPAPAPELLPDERASDFRSDERAASTATPRVAAASEGDERRAELELDDDDDDERCCVRTKGSVDSLEIVAPSPPPDAKDEVE
jgi:hypothetical protein